jgi:hypothetical protein
MGASLEKVRVRNNGRKIATFLDTAADLDRLDADYRSGRALVNPVQLIESLNHLRDVIFDKLRNYERRCTRRKNQSIPWPVRNRNKRCPYRPFTPFEDLLALDHRQCLPVPPVGARTDKFDGEHRLYFVFKATFFSFLICPPFPLPSKHSLDSYCEMR